MQSGHLSSTVKLQLYFYTLVKLCARIVDLEHIQKEPIFGIRVIPNENEVDTTLFNYSGPSLIRTPLINLNSHFNDIHGYFGVQ